MAIFAYYFQIIFLTNYVSGKIEGHVLPKSTWGARTSKKYMGGTCFQKVHGGARALKAPWSAYD